MASIFDEAGEEANRVADGESARLATLHRFEILDSPPDGAFDRVTRLAADLFDVPISIVSLVDRDRIWFKSHHGIEVEEIAREPGLCSSAILQDDPWLVENAEADPRALANPLVAGEMGLRFYAGVPLKTDEGHNLGTLCIIDRRPRTLTEQEVARLEDLAGIVMDEMKLRLQARIRAKLEAELREQAHQRKREAERIAATLQRNLLPPVLPEIDNLEIAAEYQPAAGGIEVGGDFYDVFATGANDWTIVMGDICGKGVEAASLTSLVRHTIRATATKGKKPVMVLDRLNQVLLNRDEPLNFCAATYARLKPSSKGFRLTVSTGGHPAPLLMNSEGEFVELGGGNGTILGVFEDAEFVQAHADLRPGEICVFYTDGVTEARGPEGELGEEGLRDILLQCRDLSAGVVAKEIVRATMEFQNQQLHDDVAVLVIRAVEKR